MEKLSRKRKYTEKIKKMREYLEHCLNLRAKNRSRMHRKNGYQKQKIIPFQYMKLKRNPDEV